MLEEVLDLKSHSHFEAQISFPLFFFFPVIISSVNGEGEAR